MLFGFAKPFAGKDEETGEKETKRIQKKRFRYSESNIGYDCWFSQKQINAQEILNESQEYTIFDKKEPKMYVKTIVKLSPPEKAVFKKFFDYIKDLPFTDTNTELPTYFARFLEENKIILDKEQKDYILKLIDFEINGFGPLTTLLQDKDKLEEIAVIGLGVDFPVYVYMSGTGWAKTNFYFTDEEYVKELINKMSRAIGRQISINNPMINASLPDGSRLNAIIPPISNKYPLITLRRFKYNPLTPLDLVDYGSFSTDIATFLWLSMQTDSNILVAGNTGSGKTTLLNALFSFVPKSERVILCEETPEVNIPHEHQVRLKVDEKRNIGMNELILSTLRMRPDRLIIGEIRSKDEVQSFIDTMLAGQGKGSCATFHGLSVADTIERLTKLGLLEQDLNALDLIIIQRRWNTIDLQKGEKNEIRKIVEIAEIVENKPNTLYKYNYSENKWEKINECKRIKAKTEIVFGKKWDELFEIHKNRLLKIYLENKQINISRFFSEINDIEKIGEKNV